MISYNYIKLLKLFNYICTTIKINFSILIKEKPDIDHCHKPSSPATIHLNRAHTSKKRKSLQNLLPSQKYFAEKLRKSQQQKQRKTEKKNRKNREKQRKIETNREQQRKTEKNRENREQQRKTEKNREKRERNRKKREDLLLLHVLRL